MSGPASRALPLQSLFDRFVAPYEPGVLPSRAEELLEESVRRDVELLLNSRRITGDVPKEFPNVRNSVYSWGLPDLTGMAVKSRPDRMRLKQLLEETITNMEPRLRDVRIVIDETSTLSYALRFTVAAILVAPPYADRVAFNTVVDLGSGDFRMEGNR